MTRTRGFTLIELLVVIAIITILASIVAPRVANWIERAKMGKAVSEVRNADLALTKMLADAERKNFGHFFASPLLFAQTMNSAADMYKLYTDMFYELLRRGKDADLSFLRLGADPMDPKVRRKLGSSYMDLGFDPWGIPYQFYAGPTPAAVPGSPAKQPMGWRCRRGEGYVYDAAAKGVADGEMRGNPPADGLAGYPASRDVPVYIYSFGGDGQCQQYRHFVLTSSPEHSTGDGGDDINNWDSGSGWAEFY